MNFKMHLIARVPNEGARRLAWWLATRSDGLRDLRERTQLTEAMIDRLLRGEVVPGADMAGEICVATGGVVLTPMWRSAPAGGWGDRPGDGFGPAPMMLSRRVRAAIGDATRARRIPVGWARAVRQMGHSPRTITG